MFSSTAARSQNCLKARLEGNLNILGKTHGLCCNLPQPIQRRNHFCFLALFACFFLPFSRFLANPRPQRLLGQFLLAYTNIYKSKLLYGYKVICYKLYYIILLHYIIYYNILYYIILIILYYVIPIYAYINSPVFPKFLQLPRSFRSQRRPGAHVVLPSSPALGWCHIAADRWASHRARCGDTGGVVARRCGDVVGGFGLMSDSMATSGTDWLEVPIPYIRPIFQAYFLGDIPPKYGLKNGTVPPI